MDPQDVAVGHAVGAHTVAMLGGFTSREALVATGPDFLLESLFELPAVIAQLRDDAGHLRR